MPIETIPRPLPAIVPQSDEQILETPRPSRDDGDVSGSDYRVILYNDSFHSMEQVVLQLRKATGCSPSKAHAIMLEAHRRGRAVCFRGEREACHEVVKILREIQLQCEVDCD